MAKTKILIIEDDYYVRELYSRVLVSGGYDTVLAENGEVGYDLAVEENPHLIVLDILLPGDDGITVLKKLKGTPEVKDIPVIVLSNLGNQEVIKEALENGAADYILKPEVDPTELSERVREYMNPK